MSKPESWYAKPSSGGQGLIISEADGRNVAVAYDEKDGPLLAAAPEMRKALEYTLSWLTNCNVNDPATLGRMIMAALEKSGMDKETLDSAAVALVRGPCSVPNMMGEDDE